MTILSKLRIPVFFDFSSHDREDRSSFTFSFGLALSIFGLLSGTSHFWSAGGFEFLSSFRSSLIIGTLLMVLGLSKTSNWSPRELLSPSGLAMGMLIVFLSDWMNRGYNLLQGPTIRGEIILGGLLFWFLRKRLTVFLSILLFLTVLVPWFSFIEESAGRLLFSDDHASFGFRLNMLKEHFPNIPFFNPLWNAGFDARDFFATGSVAIYLLYYPLIEFFKVESTYNLIVCLSLFLVPPIAAYAAATVAGSNKKARLISAILSVGISLFWYRWALKYGTLGFTVAVGLMPLNIVLTGKFLEFKEELSSKFLLLYFFTLSITLLWPGSATMLVPLILFMVASLPLILKDRKRLIWLVGFIFCHSLWLGPFIAVTKIDKFLGSAAQTLPTSGTQNPNLTNEISSSSKKVFKSKVRSISINEEIKHLREHSVSANPLLMFLGIPFLFFVKHTKVRNLLLLQSLWFIIAGGILYPLKPQLELDRMLVVLFLTSIIPAGIAIERLLTENLDNKLRAILASLVAGFLFAIPWSTSVITRNRSPEIFYFASDMPGQMAEQIKLHAGEGRVLFSGFVLQEFSGGHISPLAGWTNHPLVTAAFYHTAWWYTDVIPESFRSRGEEGISEFLNLYNVSVVGAHEKFWKRYFKSLPDKYELIWSFENFQLFKRIGFNSSYFIEGSGKILSQPTDGVLMKLEQPDAVIKFHYYDFLEAPGCQVAPFEAAPGVIFTKLSGCPVNQEIKLKSIGPWMRVKKYVE